MQDDRDTFLAIQESTDSGQDVEEMNARGAA